MVHKVWGQTNPPSGLGRIPVHFLALIIYVFNHYALPRASSHLKSPQEYFFYNEESFGMLKPDLVELGFPPFLATLLPFFKGNGPKWGTWPTTAPFCPISVDLGIL
jgi:hypothetical protein